MSKWEDRISVSVYGQGKHRIITTRKPLGHQTEAASVFLNKSDALGSTYCKWYGEFSELHGREVNLHV